MQPPPSSVVQSRAYHRPDSQVTGSMVILYSYNVHVEKAQLHNLRCECPHNRSENLSQSDMPQANLHFSAAASPLVMPCGFPLVHLPAAASCTIPPQSSECLGNIQTASSVPSRMQLCSPPYRPSIQRLLPAVAIPWFSSRPKAPSSLTPCAYLL